MDYTVINSFREEHGFLSNFDTAPFVWRNVLFNGGEYAFNWAKVYHLTNGFDHTARLRQQIIDAPTPTKAKYYGRSLPLNVEEWDNRKVHYMREIVHAKFAGVPDYAGKLLRTGCRPLVEGNTWNDGFWGKYKNADGVVVGLNMLGTILMEERGSWLWGRQDCEHRVGSDLLTVEQMERITDYG